MAKKQKHPEHINLERYLISYADFITLLFATFVVLYALSQVDISDFQKLEKSMKQAFAAPSIMQGSNSFMQDSSSIFNESDGETMITPLMLEYMSQRYEDKSIEEIEKTINDMSKKGELDGVESIKTDKGLVIRFNDDYLFQSGSAVLTKDAKEKLNKVGATIAQKFILHYMRIEGHTDNQPMKSSIYPSNWELSSARASSIIRYFINKFAFMPSLFTAVGFADTRPLVENDSIENRKKNRRVEIFILKNKYKSAESPADEFVKFSRQQQEELQRRRLDALKNVHMGTETLTQKNEQYVYKPKNEAVVIKQTYNNEIKRLSKQMNALDSNLKEKITGENSGLRPPAQSGQFKSSSKFNFGE